jgi:hypothetical protein
MADTQGVQEFLDVPAQGDFDSLAAFDFDDAEGAEVTGTILNDGPYSMPDAQAGTKFKGNFVSFANADTPEERIEQLFAQMPTLDRMLYAILKMAATPIFTDDLAAQIEELKVNHHSVYAPLTFCGLLEEAGALAQTDAEGNLLTEVEQEPLQTEIDGELYWQVCPPPPVYWCVTEPGQAALDAYNPFALIGELFEAEAHYAEIFTTVLEMCSKPGGCSLKEIGDVVDDEPVLQSPKRYAMYFIDKLEHAGAVKWEGAWCATPDGIKYLTSQNR